MAGAKDKGDLDQLTVGPLPVQEAILEALGRLGSGFESADLGYGRVGGTGQQLPFHQEIELSPAPQYAHRVNEIQLTFLANPGGMEVFLEADKRGGFLLDGHDALSRFTVSHDGVGHQDWNTIVDGWIRRLVGHRAPCGSHDVYGHEGHHGHGHGEHHHDGHRSGPGVGTAIAAGAHPDQGMSSPRAFRDRHFPRASRKSRELIRRAASFYVAVDISGASSRSGSGPAP